ncbi:hypothetical protein [Azohydromonas caseinilytica]|uniref:Uncharacterized protein n=1 Tax=Azohydromonas caseinilytica TaxID=2728836 RepID=A0A848FE80_9BURK|nr:hypothetical protein [Azohydromonas caseinilytica]NML18517.1 hypothetical protein [Azohydromonas caseinilytica]
MNSTTTTTSRTSSAAPAHSRDDDRRAAPDKRSVADFERALRQRSKLQDQGGRQDQAGDTEPPPLEAALPAPPPSFPAPFALVLAQAQAQATPIEAPPPARGLVEPPPAALRAELSQPAPGAADAARAFEVSLREPLGGGVTLHAVAPVAGAGWTLSVGAHGLNPQELRRNLGRLEERLRAKALPHEPLELHRHPDHHREEDTP